MIKERFDRLLHEVQTISAEKAGKLTGQTLPVLVEEVNGQDASLVTGKLTNNSTVHFPGTGDIFSAVFIGKLMSGKDLQTATAEAMDAVKSMIGKNADNVDKYKGIPLETCMEVLD